MPDRRRLSLLLTCEHGGNRIPSRYRRALAVPVSVLASHRGLDLGALAAARTLARRLRAPLAAAETTRLLVDLNRSPGHPRLFSEYSRRLEDEARADVLACHYFPHRRRVEAMVGRRVAAGETVLHVAVHSFTPRLGGEVRGADLGLLYDPRRGRERALCARWRALLEAVDPELRVRRNYPYRGVADGLTTALRRRFPARAYLGIELELSQGRIGRPGRERVRVIAATAATLERLLLSPE